MKNFYFTLGWNPKLVGYGLRRPAPIDNILNSNRFVFEIFHNLDKNKTVWIQNVNNWCSTTETITYKFWVSPQCEIKMLYENYRRKRKSFSITFLCPFELGLSSSPVSKLWNISRAMSSTLIQKDKKSKRNHFLFFR